MGDPYLEAIANGIDPSWLLKGSSAARSAAPPPPMPTAPMPNAPTFTQAPAPIRQPGPLERDGLGAQDSVPVASPPPVPAPPPLVPTPHPFPLRMASPGGAVNIPAHETELRGPTVKGAQDQRNVAAQAAIDAVNERNQQMAASDYAVALERERKANIQADAAAYSMAERQQEMEERQADFDRTTSALAKQASDPKNFYTEPNVGQKLAALISAGLAGFVAGKTGRPGNVGLDVINGWAAKEARAQEMAFQLTRDTAQAKQTAFSMAMQKYNNVDAARAQTRAALAEVGQAELAKQAAMWRGTEAQNQATLAGQALTDERLRQIMAGTAFTPAQTVVQGPTYVDENGIRYNESQARGVAETQRTQGFEREKQATGVAGQILVEGAKQDAAQTKNERGLMVQLPNGDIVKAPDEKEAGKLRETAVAVHNVNRIVNQAREIRANTGWRADPRAVKRLEQLQSEATIAAKEIGNLGVLAGPDMELTNKMVGDMTSVMPGVDKQLGSFADSASAALRNRVKTYADAPGSAKGQMPASFTPHGKK